MQFNIPAEHKNATGVYIIRNSVNAKVYVGSAVNLRKRFVNHEWRLLAGTHANQRLQRAFIKYSSNTFHFELLELCERCAILEREQFFINKHDAANELHGYNIAQIAGSPRSGARLTDEQKQKISDGNRGKKKSKEAIERAWATKRATGRDKMAPEVIERMRSKAQGKAFPAAAFTQEANAKREQTKRERNPGRGKLTDAVCKGCGNPFQYAFRRIRLYCSRSCTPMPKASTEALLLSVKKMQEANKGKPRRPHSEETREKIRASKKGVMPSQATLDGRARYHQERLSKT